MDQAMRNPTVTQIATDHSDQNQKHVSCVWQSYIWKVDFGGAN